MITHQQAVDELDRLSSQTGLTPLQILDLLKWAKLDADLVSRIVTLPNRVREAS